ncbi:MAG: ABC transporter ATP-binding protein [Acidimicrobiales bacterium]
MIDIGDDTFRASAAVGHLEVHGLSHEYTREGSAERQLALDGIEMDIAAGELVCVLGASGCGKSTLLLLLAGLIQPTAGTILLDAKVVSGPSRERGMVFQEYALLPWKTVAANVALGPRLQGKSRAEARSVAERYLELVGLAGSGKKYPHELSGGMRQRAAVARTLAAEPAVLLMDEPFAAVDAQTRSALQEELVEIWQRTKRTIVFVTHSVEEAALLADRVVVMTSSPGRVKELHSVTTPRSVRFTPEGMPANAATASALLQSVRQSPVERDRPDRPDRPPSG